MLRLASITALSLLALANPIFAQTASSKRGGELVIFGHHGVHGQRNGEAYKGALTIYKNSSFQLNIEFKNGIKETRTGFVAVHIRQLKFIFKNNKARFFNRVEKNKIYHWRSEIKGDVLTLSNGQRVEGALAVVGRVAKRKRLFHWLLGGNIGTVAGAKESAIYRSKEPTPDRIANWKKKGVKTVLSFNSDLNHKGWLHPRDEKTGRKLAVREVNLRDFIKAQGMEHVVVKMSASKAPTDVQLRRIFKLLLDGHKKPLLFHCKGGSDRTGVIAALYQIEFLGYSKARAKKLMRKHLWAASDGTEIQGLYIDLYRKGHIRNLLKK
jgi:protein-tyrosine phosphatase